MLTAAIKGWDWFLGELGDVEREREAALASVIIAHAQIRGGIDDL